MDGFARIKRISRRDDGRLLVCVTVGNASGNEDIEFLILDELFEGLSDTLRAGETDEDTVARLDEYADITAAFSSACASLAFTQCSAKALLRKLIGKGFSRSSCEAALRLVTARGYIDESAIATRRAEIMLSKLWGRSRILSKLREEGFCDLAIEDARAYLGEVDFSDNCARIIEKRYAPVPTDHRDREKMYASLMRLGYSSFDIKEALRRLENYE